MLKKSSVIVLLLCLSANLNGLDFDGLFVGLGVAGNAHTRMGSATGGIAMSGFRLADQYELGLKISFFHNINTVSSLEPQLFVRYCPSEGKSGPIVQVETGGIIYWEYSEVFPAYTVGLSGGWRFQLNDKWFVEPMIQFGYPYLLEAV